MNDRTVGSKGSRGEVQSEEVGEPSERPTFSTNIFDGREEAREMEDQEDQEDQIESRIDRIMHWVWLFSAIMLFFGGVAISYYIVNYSVLFFIDKHPCAYPC